MSLFETLRLALKNIAGSKLRTFLTMLGIIIGVTAVIVIVGLGNGMANYMEDSFATLGTNTLNVVIMGRGSTRSVSEEQMYAMVAEHPDLFEAISPSVSVSGLVRVGTTDCEDTKVTGVSEDYFRMKDYEIARGRGLQYMDIAERKPVCVIGTYVAQKCFGGNAVGQEIKVGTLKLTIVGVMDQEADTPESGGTDDCVFLPYSTAARYSGVGTINSYVITIVSEDTAAEAKTQVEDTLYGVFRNSDAYSVISMTEILDMMKSVINVVISILAVIAAISLVVGGIGIMNIMLVSVTERTREIGIRKALGAKERVILFQFVTEAAVTSALGGSIGIALGYLLSSLATAIIAVALDTPMQVTPSASSVLMAFGVSAGIGVLFGYLPARKAARLNPIDALRYE